jgi:hypothetical protein
MVKYQPRLAVETAVDVELPVRMEVEISSIMSSRAPGD